MPCGKLCLCALQQALLVMAVVPDVRGGLQILVAKPHSSVCCMRIIVYSTMSSEQYTKPFVTLITKTSFYPKPLTNAALDPY